MRVALLDALFDMGQEMAAAQSVDHMFMQVWQRGRSWLIAATGSTYLWPKVQDMLVVSAAVQLCIGSFALFPSFGVAVLNVSVSFVFLLALAYGYVDQSHVVVPSVWPSVLICQLT
jgi:hypothetical protein